MSLSEVILVFATTQTQPSAQPQIPRKLAAHSRDCVPLQWGSVSPGVKGHLRGGPRRGLLGDRGSPSDMGSRDDITTHLLTKDDSMKLAKCRSMDVISKFSTRGTPKKRMPTVTLGLFDIT